MTNPIEATGLLVFYVNVGTVPPYRAESFVERFEDHFKSKMLKEHKLPDNVVLLFVPVRPPQETRLEYIPMVGVDTALLTQIMEIHEKTRQFWNDHKPEEFDDIEKEAQNEDIVHKSWWKGLGQLFGW